MKTKKTPIPTAPSTVDFHIYQGDVKHIGRVQIAQEYGMNSTKVHRLLGDSGIEVVHFVNRHFYPEPAIRQYFESLGIKQVSQAPERTK